MDQTRSDRQLEEKPLPQVEDRVLLHYQIANLSCASCVKRAENALSAVPGVNDVVVNLATNTASLMVDVNCTDAQQAVAKAADKAGYPISALADQSEQIEQQNDELLTLRKNVTIATLLCLPVFVLEMGGHLFSTFHHFIINDIGQQTSWIIQFVLTTVILAWPGRLFYTRGLPALFKGAPDMNALVALGTAAAWGYSTVATFYPVVLPVASRAVYFEAAAVIVTLILLGRYLESRAKGRTGQAIAKLIGLRGKQARVRKGGEFIMTPIATIQIDDEIQVKPGERIAADGTLIDGTSHVDESMITGEPIPVKKQVGDTLTGGTINGTGAMIMRVTHVGDDTVIAQIIRLVEQAQAARLPIQQLVNQVTAWFVPAVIVISVLTTLAWAVWGSQITLALVAGVSVLIVACPCAMGLATPTSIMVGTGRAAQLGVLFRRGDALQRLADVRLIALDKTGTLTKGRPELTHWHKLESATGSSTGIDRPYSDDALLAMVASIEQRSEHPIAEAIVREAQRQQLKLSELDAFESLTGLGVSARINNQQWLIGSMTLMTNSHIETNELEEKADSWAEQGHTPLFVAVDGKAIAVLCVSDALKASSKAAIEALHREGFTIAMITGDDKRTANYVAQQLDIDKVVAGVLPKGKVDAIERLQQEFDTVMFVGDGINDAPALAQADIGMAIGTGTDIAIDSADVVLMSGNLDAVQDAIRISKYTLRNIRQNLGWAFGYNIVLIPIAAGLLYPSHSIMLSPMLAAAAMALSSVFVIANALRLRFLPASAAQTSAKAV